MWPCIRLLFLTVLHSCNTQGLKFLKKGEDLLLDFDADVPEKFSFVEWKFNNTVTLVRFLPDGEGVSKLENGTFEFPDKKYSLKLKNVQEANSGVYTAKVISLKGDKVIDEYTFIVEGPVSPVNLTVNTNASGSCELTVSCRTQDSHINSTFTCVNQACSQEGGEQSRVTTSGASLQLYLQNNAIICNHSNHVSKEVNHEIIQNFCLPDPDPPAFPILVVVILVIVLTNILVLGLGLLAYGRRRNDRRESLENTVYAVPEGGPTIPRNLAQDDSGQHSNSTYSYVGYHLAPLELTETRGPAQIDSMLMYKRSPCPHSL